MAAGYSESVKFGRGSGMRTGGRFETLSRVGTGDFNVSTPDRKRQRRSTGGGSADISPEQSEAMKLCLNNFKEMDSESKLDTIFECLQNIKCTNDNRITHIENSVNTLRGQARDTHDKVKTLQYKSVDMEARSRRCNLLFRGIVEPVGENNLQALQALQDLLADKLDLDPDSICIQRVHRVGRPPSRRFGGQVRDRPLIAAFRDFQDVEMIILNANKLKGTGYGVNRDLPKEILDARKPLWTKYKEEKTADPLAKLTIAYPAKLIKNGRVIADALPEWHSIMKKSRFEEPSLSLPIFPEHESNQTQPGPDSNEHPEVMDYNDRSKTEDASDSETEPHPNTPGMHQNFDMGDTNSVKSPGSSHAHGQLNRSESERSDGLQGSTNVT